MVLSHLIEGELFNSNDNIYYTIFNNFIIKNYKRINTIIDNIIKISEPYRDNINKEKTEINDLDSSTHKSICFNLKDFLLFYNTIHAYKDEILNGDKYIEDIYNNIQKNISLLQYNSNNYYLIINESQVKPFEKTETKIALNNTSINEDDLLKKLKYAIIYVLENTQLTINLDDNLSIKKTFEVLNDYLSYYFKPTLNSIKPPLSWYSKYIINNLDSLSNKYKENDFQLFFEEIRTNLNNTVIEYRNINEYLTINLTLKLNKLEKIINIYKNQFDKIKKVEINTKTLIIIESEEIKICLMNGAEYNEIIKSEKKAIDNNLLILSNSDFCPHNKLILSTKEKKYKERRHHCNNIKEFAKKFSEYHGIISKEIKNFSFGSNNYNIKDIKEKKKN